MGRTEEITVTKKQLCSDYESMGVREICAKYDITLYMFYQIIDKNSIPRKSKSPYKKHSTLKIEG